MSNPIKDVKNFISFAAKELKLNSMPTIHLVGSSENIKNAFGHFLGTRKGKVITVRITDRHPIDVMRTIAHELIHYKQTISGVTSSEQMKEDEANALAGRIMRNFDVSHPSVFKDKAIPSNFHEDAIAGAPVNAVSDSSPSNPNSPIAQPEKMLFKKTLKRKAPVEENIVDQLLSGNMNARHTVKKHKPKGLRSIVGPGGTEEKNEKRAETRIS